MSGEKRQKGVFFKKIFGRKSREDKLAEKAAFKAAQQTWVDRDMAERMAIINAAALKSACEQDKMDKGVDTSAEDQAGIEEKERKRAEKQTEKNVEAARQMASKKKKAEAEKKVREKAEAKHKAEEARKKEGEKKHATEKARLEKECLAEKKRRAFPKTGEETEHLEAALLRKDTAVQHGQKQETAKTKEAVEKEKKTAVESAVKPKKKSFLVRITEGLRKSSSRVSETVTTVFKKRKLDAKALEELEDLLIASDLGTGPAMRVTELLSRDKFNKEVTDMEIKIALADAIGNILGPLEKPLKLVGAKPEIMLFVGVNGSGKTTTLGKIAKLYTDQGKKVLIVAADTFRAAAVEQLRIWGNRANAPVVSGKLDVDAASLVFDAIRKAKSGNFDILMIDTAGRLQNRTELMDELAKIVRVIKKYDECAPHHAILVLDATVGQNALLQTEAFLATAGVTGLIMTKLDGTAKGGILVALADKFKLPIHAIGIGERIEDLENFSAAVFAAALSGIAFAVLEHDVFE